MARSSFRRVVLGLAPGQIDRRILRATLEFARLLELEMLGVFVEDQALLGLARLPFARELRLPDHGWHAFEPERVLADLRAAAEQARKLFDQEIAEQGIACHFEVRRGDPATLVCSLGGQTDIVVVAEPAAAAERATTAVARTQRAAAQSPAAVLFLPPSVMPSKGPVAVFAASTADAAAVLASHIAEAAGEESIPIPPPRHPEAFTRSLARALGRRRERLVVMTRGIAGSSDETPILLAAERGVPVLTIEPASKAKAA